MWPSLNSRSCRSFAVFKNFPVNTCDDTICIGLPITNHKLLYGSNPHTLKVPESSCISQCFDDQFCQAVTYIPKDSTCSFHNGQAEVNSVKES